MISSTMADTKVVHLTPEPTESIYSGVVSLRALILIIFIAELNSLQLWGADASSAYLEANTQEKVYFIAGGEFGNLEGHTLLVDKALYGLRSSGLRWHKKLADILHDIVFQQCKAESNIWMRKKLNVYEYIAVYVDDLAIAAIDPVEIIDKGVGPLVFHLGCDFQRDEDGILSFGPKK
jgi:Reverse transcriptase (RNA-dependent DNA polymerase)